MGTNVGTNGYKRGYKRAYKRVQTGTNAGTNGGTNAGAAPQGFPTSPASLEAAAFLGLEALPPEQVGAGALPPRSRAVRENNPQQQ